MRIFSHKVIREFAKQYSDSAASLDSWYRIVRRAEWKSGADVKQVFSNSDFVGEKTVFNIALNRYRLIAYISFTRQAVYITAILTHKAYDKGDWK